MSQLRPVNLGNGRSSEPKMMTHQQAANYEVDKQSILNAINSAAAALQQHNEAVAPIVESYKRRTGQ